jgi:hypothetical protein
MRIAATKLAILSMAITSLAVPAFAGQGASAESMRRTVAVKQDAALGEATLRPGSYEVELAGGAEPVLIFRQKKQEVARVRVERQALEHQSNYDQVGLANAEGQRRVVSVTFKGARETFVVKDAGGLAIAAKP